MARMLLASSLSMTRKTVAVAVVLLIAGLAPAAAVIGFCAKMPCCVPEPHDVPALAANDAGCCTTISCYEAPSHELTLTAKEPVATIGAPVVLPLLASVPAVRVSCHAFDDTSPPLTTKQRLSRLSILLI